MLLGLLGLLALEACSSGHGDRSGDFRDASAGSSGALPVVDDGTTAGGSGAHATKVMKPAVAIATGGRRETDYRIGQDLETFIAPDAGITLEVLATKGSADNLQRLADDPRVDLAIVQYDVLRAMAEEAKRGDATAARLIDPLRVVMPLYTEEIHFVVRSDSTMKSVDDIKGRRINLGVKGSGSALTATALYRRMFRSAIAPANVRYLTDDQALSALVVDKSVDVVVVVAAQPSQLFQEMKPEARKYIKLLPVGEGTPTTREATKAYLPATIRAASYSSWLTHDVATLSVVSFLVTTARRDNLLTPHLPAFASALCRNLGTLRMDGHPKWQEVRPDQQLQIGLPYATASATELKNCTAR